MPVDIHKLLAAIVPDVYCDPEVRKEVKKIVKEELAKGSDRPYLKAADKAKLFKGSVLYFYNDAMREPLANWGLKSPSEEHEIEYHSSSEGLEPLYFWTLDFMTRQFGGDVEKIIDNFISSPGSGHFSELMGKATRMQEEAMKMLGAANQVIKSILNLIYDLKEMKLLLKTYDDLNSDDEMIRRGAKLSMKQRWMDMVDFVKRGTTSLKQLAAQMDYVTIIDAFMTADSLEDVENLDLNDRVKRILKQRVRDYLAWIDESENQLRTRYKIEVNYLRSQVNTVKLYSRWIRPYLKAAKQLEQQASPQAGLVDTFNSILLELTILAKADYNPQADINNGTLPKSFERTKSRKYYSVTIVEFHFRGIPQRVSQRGDWAFGGRVILKFKSYGLNEEELRVFRNQLEKDDVGEMMKLIEGTTTESLEALKEDIDEFLNDDLGEKRNNQEKRRIREQDVNPFTALFSFLKTEKKQNKKGELSLEIKPDSEYEKVLRSQAIIESRDQCHTVFDIYKKAHGMPDYPDPFQAIP